MLGHYRIVCFLKSGGMGEIYLADDTSLPRQVAVKVMHTDFAHYDDVRSAKRLFQQEAQAAASLDHPHILTLYESGEAYINEMPLTYIAMPYRVEGSLEDWQRLHYSFSPLPLSAVDHIVGQAAAALQHAHDHHIIHKDVKLSNFLVQNGEEKPEHLNVQLTDFGIAKFMFKTSDSHVVRGTGTHMAPEHWEGHPVPATDQYALAIMTYFLLTGHLPFTGAEQYQLMWQHCHVLPQPPSTFNPRLSKEIDSVLLKALAKKPSNRFSSVEAFAQALHEAILHSGTIHRTLTINKFEALNGTSRQIPLASGKIITATIPAGVHHGQIVRMEGCGEQTTYNGPFGALLLIIDIEPEKEAPPEPLPPKPRPAPRPVVPKVVAPAPPQPQIVLPKRTRPRRNPWLIGFIVLLILGMLSLCYMVETIAAQNIHAATIASAATAASDDATATVAAKAQATQDANTNNPYPAYFSGSGTLALYDPLHDDAGGYGWLPRFTSTLPTKNGNCFFKDGSLHVHVEGNETYPVSFHACITSTPIFKDFTFETQMTFISGDCGGMIIRSKGPHFYQFYICQNGQYGVIRYVQDVSDTTINPIIKQGTSSAIVAGQGNEMAIIAQGSTLNLYVNMQQIDSIQDVNYTDGTIGVFAKALHLHSSTEVAFSDAKVWM